jgi:hypothetical protein
MNEIGQYKVDWCSFPGENNKSYYQGFMSSSSDLIIDHIHYNNINEPKHNMVQ